MEGVFLLVPDTIVASDDWYHVILSFQTLIQNGSIRVLFYH